MMNNVLFLSVVIVKTKKTLFKKVKKGKDSAIAWQVCEEIYRNSCDILELSQQHQIAPIVKTPIVKSWGVTATSTSSTSSTTSSTLSRGSMLSSRPTIGVNLLIL